MHCVRLLVLASVTTAVKTHEATCGSSSCKQGGCPTDDAVQTSYLGQYTWSSSIAWSCVYSISDYAGASDDVKFVAAQNDAVRNGGGVVYFPPGDYYFQGHMYLNSTVSIRGAPDSRPAHTGPIPGTLAPASRLHCPLYQHYSILNYDPHATNMAVVNVELDGCGVMLWPGLSSTIAPTAPWDIKGYWINATNITGQGSNKIVLGNVIHDVSLGNATRPWTGHVATTPWPWSYAAALTVYTDKNVLVANNMLPQSTRPPMNVTITLFSRPGQKPVQNVTLSVPYLIDNRYGIDVNRLVTSKPCNLACSGDFGLNGTGRTPDCCPSAFPTGVVVRDNYVFQNGRVGIQWAGMGDGVTPGSGAQVMNNHVTVRPNTTCWSIDGYYLMTGSDTNENRCYDAGGWDSNVTGNTGWCSHQSAAGTAYMTVDGEGILWQLYDNVNGLRNSVVNNDLTVSWPGYPSYGSPGTTGFISFYNLLLVQNNSLVGNKVIPSEYIGAKPGSFSKTGVNSGNICDNDQPPCVDMNP